MKPAVKIDFANERKFRERNKVRYRLAHWPPEEAVEVGERPHAAPAAGETF